MSVTHCDLLAHMDQCGPMRKCQGKILFKWRIKIKKSNYYTKIVNKKLTKRYMRVISWVKIHTSLPFCEKLKHDHEMHDIECWSWSSQERYLEIYDIKINSPNKYPRKCVLIILKENFVFGKVKFVLDLKVGSFLRWIHESSAHLRERSFEQSSKVWSGMEIIGAMEKQGITPGTFYIYYVCDLAIYMFLS